MRKLLVLMCGVGLAALPIGCVAAIGDGGTSRSSGTLGQQLIDLKKANEAGAISDAEFEVQKAKLLGKK